MRHRLLRLPVAVSALILAACSNPVSDVKAVFQEIPTEPTPGMSPEQFQLTQLAAESARIRGQGLLGGAAAGGIISALVCQGEFRCIVPVTAGGATIGYAAGYYLAQKKEDAEREQTGIQASIQGAKGSLDFYEERAVAAEKVVSQNRRRIAEMNRGAVSSETGLAAYRQEYETMRDDRTRIAAMSSQLSSDINFMTAEINARGTFKNENTTELEAQREALRRINQRMEAQLAAMDEALEQVPDAVKA